MSSQVCSQCQLIFQSMDALNDHMLSAHQLYYSKGLADYLRVYACDLCDEFFGTSAKLEAHKAQCHGQASSSVYNFQCSLCGLEFASPNSIKYHLSYEHKVDAAGVDNEIAFDNQFVESQEAEVIPESESIQSSSNTYNRLYQCNQCGRMFNSHEQLTSHQPTHKSAKSKYECLQCPETFAKISHLNKHVKLDHPKFRRQLKEAKSLQKAKQLELEESMPDDPIEEEDNNDSNCVIESVSNQQTLMLLTGPSEGNLAQVNTPNNELPATTDAMHRCYHCGLVFKTELIIRRHFLNAHKSLLYPQNNDQPSSVGSSSKKRNLAKEKKVKRSSKKGKKTALSNEVQVQQPIMCVHCGLHFSTLLLRNSHLLSSPVCRASIQRATNAQSSTGAGGTPVQIVCGLCGLVFPNASQLSDHLSTHITLAVQLN